MRIRRQHFTPHSSYSGTRLFTATMFLAVTQAVIMPWSRHAVGAPRSSPLAVVTQAGGAVMLLQGARQTPVKAGLALRAGDRLEMRGGSATVFFLNGTQRQLKGTSTLVIAAPTAKAGGSLLRGAYVGLSQGFASGGGRMAATMREGTLEPVSPLDTAVLDEQTSLKWKLGGLDADAIVGYEVEVLSAMGVLTRVRTTRTELPLKSLAIPRDVTLRWRVTPYGRTSDVAGKKEREQPVVLWRSRDVSFSLASAATKRAVQAALTQIDGNSKLTPAERRLARAALLSGRSFYDAALRELQGVNTPEAKTLQLALLPPSQKTTGTQPPLIQDEALKRDVYARDVLTPQSLKTYTEPRGLYSLRIPISWGYQATDLGGGAQQVLWAARPFSSPQLSVTIAPRATMGSTPLTQRIWNFVRAQQGVLIYSPATPVTWNNRAVERQTWKLNYGGIVTQGTAWKWSEKGRDVVAMVGEYPGDAVYAQQLAPCLASLRINAAPARATPTPNPWDKVTNATLLQSMRAIYNLHGDVDTGLRVKEASTDNRSRDQKVQPGEFERYRVAYSATKPGTSQKSQAASQAAGVAAALGWQAIRANQFEEAQQWFERRAAFESRAYHNSIVICRARMAANESQIKKLRVAVPPLATAGNVNVLLDLKLGLQQSYIMQAQIMAYLARDGKTHEEFSRRTWRIACERIDNKSLGGTYASAAPELKAGDQMSIRFENDWRSNRRVDAADVLINLCEAALLNRDFDRAEALAQRSLAWQRALPASFNKRNETFALLKLALIADRKGDYIVARARYEELLKELQASQKREEAHIATLVDPDNRLLGRMDIIQKRALALNNLGNVLNILSDFEGSQARYQQALRLLDTPDKDIFIASKTASFLPKVPDAPAPTAPASAQAQKMNEWYKAELRASIKSNLANLEISQGNFDKSLQLLDEASKLLLATGQDAGAAVALLNRASVFLERDQLVEAARTIRTAQAIFTQLQDTENLTTTTGTLARIAWLAGYLPQAEKLGIKALRLARLTRNFDSISIATRTLALTRIYQWKEAAPGTRDSKLLASAATLIREAEAADARSGNVERTSNTLPVRASLQEAQGDFKGALASLQMAIARVEAIRANANSEQAFSNLRDVSNLYERTVRLQLQLGQNAEAFDTLSRARSKRLFDSLKLSNLTSPDPAIQGLLDKAARLENQQSRLRSQIQAESELDEAERDPAKIAELRQLLAAAQAEYGSISKRITVAHPGFDKALSINPLQLKQAQASIPPGALLLQYAPLDKKLYIFAITRNSLKIYSPATSAKSIVDQAKALNAAVQKTGQNLIKGGDRLTPENDPAFVAASTALYNALVAPVASEWKRAQVVAIVPNGELCYLPFHALARKTPAGLKFWIEDKPLTYLMGADVLSSLKPNTQTPKGGVLALGDPPGANLPAARGEVMAVARLFPASQALVGASASKDVLLGSKTLRKRALHLAAHGVLDPMRPERSFIQLAPPLGTTNATVTANAKRDDGKLRISEIYGLNFKGVDLVTLSACQTAQGATKPNGTEITSLAESFASAGTPTVVASLWNVEDTSTRTLMERFYKGLADGRSKGEALRATQIALLKNPNTSHPFFWAPFELLGDWR